MKKLIVLPAVIAVSMLFNACKKDDDNTPNPPPGNTRNLVLNISGLGDLGSTAQYEGWIIVNETPVSTGKFTVNQNGVLSKTHFPVNNDQLNNATAFVLTIEPVPDNSPIPHDRHILAGEFSGNSASVTTMHGEALGADLTTGTGTYILATPTTSTMTDELSGVWFIDGSGGMGNEMPGLNLPALPAGWVYEGWAVINGEPVTTGRFKVTNQADQAAPFSGPLTGPPFPGEDFIQNAPPGLSFPTNLQSQMIVVTLEPEPDNSPEPFFIRPVAGMVPANAIPLTNYPMNNEAASTLPSGTVTR
jgi:hypothetical protein